MRGVADSRMGMMLSPKKERETRKEEHKERKEKREKRKEKKKKKEKYLLSLVSLMELAEDEGGSGLENGDNVVTKVEALLEGVDVEHYETNGT